MLSIRLITTIMSLVGWVRLHTLVGERHGQTDRILRHIEPCTTSQCWTLLDSVYTTASSGVWS